MPKKIIYAEDAIDALKAMALPLHLDSACEDIWERDRTLDNAIDVMRGLPPAQPDYQEVLGWLLAYHTMSFNLHGRYLPHEVISWLINDFTKEFIAEETG